MCAARDAECARKLCSCDARGDGRNMRLQNLSFSLRGMWRALLIAGLLAVPTGCGVSGAFPGPGCVGTVCGGGGGGGGLGVKAPTLLNLSDAAPDRVIALSLHITDIKFHQTSGASVTALNNAGGVTVEMTHRQALFEPINLETT